MVFKWHAWFQSPRDADLADWNRIWISLLLQSVPDATNLSNALVNFERITTNIYIELYCLEQRKGMNKSNWKNAYLYFILLPGSSSVTSNPLWKNSIIEITI